MQLPEGLENTPLTQSDARVEGLTKKLCFDFEMQSFGLLFGVAIVSA